MRAFVIFRDRVTYAQQCVAALMLSGLDPVIVDQGSTWPRAVAWLARLEHQGTLVLRHGDAHPRSLWGWPPFEEQVAGQRYVVTDPDVIPADDCPHDWAVHLGSLLDDHPEAAKAGLGLRTDNLPDHYYRKQQVIDWEAKFWNHPAGDGAYRAGVDTTLALYRAGQVSFQLDGALRTGPPYLADHLPWHENLTDLPEEIAYYYEHAVPGIAHWAPKGRSAWGD